MKNPLFYNHSGDNYHCFGIEGFDAYFEVTVFPRLGFHVGFAGEYAVSSINLSISCFWVDINIRIPTPFAN